MKFCLQAICLLDFLLDSQISGVLKNYYASSPSQVNSLKVIGIPQASNTGGLPKSGVPVRGSQ